MNHVLGSRAFYTITDLRHRFGVPHSVKLKTILAQVEAGKFPAPREVVHGNVRWNIGEITQAFERDPWLAHSLEEADARHRDEKRAAMLDAWLDWRERQHG